MNKHLSALKLVVEGQIGEGDDCNIQWLIGQCLSACVLSYLEMSATFTSGHIIHSPLSFSSILI